MRRKIGKAIMILSISMVFWSCEKEEENINSYFIMNEKKVEIETANLTYFANIANEFDVFKIQVYSKGVSVFKDKYLSDSVIYPRNAIKLEYYLYKPHDLTGYSGTYVTNHELYPSAYSMRQCVYFNSSTDIWGIYEYADSAKVILKELDGQYDLYFEFIKHGTDKSPESIDIKGNYFSLN